MPSTVLADTGFWLALMSHRDQHHSAAIAAAERCSGRAFVMTWPVVTECCHLLTARAGGEVAGAFLAMHGRGAYRIVEPAIHPLDKVEALMRKYADLPMDLADASLVLLAGTLGHGEILSTDRREFRAYRWKNHEPFSNLLVPD